MRGDVYEQSRWLALKVVQLYYHEGFTQDEISRELRISKPTVSRLLKRGKEQEYIKFLIPEDYEKSLAIGETIQSLFNLMDVIVVPRAFEEDVPEEEDDHMRSLVAMEGARYLQRIITPKDILGIGWGRTISRLVNYLNPCQRMDIPFITLHGNIEAMDPSVDVEYLVRRITMAFGGRYLSLKNGVLRPSPENLKEVMEEESVRKVFSMMDRITITIASLSGYTAELPDPLVDANYLTPEENKFLQDNRACCEIMLRFLNQDGEEIPSEIADRTLGVDLDTLRQVPCKITVASGVDKALAVATALKAHLADVLIIDEALAEELLNITGCN